MGVKLSKLKVFKSCKSHFVGMQLTMYMLTNINTSLEILKKKESNVFMYYVPVDYIQSMFPCGI